MQHSAFDLAVFAKTYQEYRLKEAEKSRHIDEALSRGQVGRRGARLTSGRLVATVRSWFSGRTETLAEQPVAANPYLSMGPLPDGSAFGRAVPGSRSIRAAEPYAAMVVLARASAAPIAEQPCMVRDC